MTHPHPPKSSSPPATLPPSAPMSDEVKAAPTLAPTYFSTQALPAFATAKTLLQSSTTDCMTVVQALLDETKASTNDDLHPAMAPLFYLYGTALLYEVEDKVEQMMDDTDQDGAADDIQEDGEIAWENLDTARTIIEQLMKTTDLESGPEGANKASVSLDLAQIYSRLADLSQKNGHYQKAAEDYTKCLALRNMFMGKFEKKVGDAYISLAGVLMRLAIGEGEGPTTTLPQSDKEAFAAESVKSYTLCGLTFAGMAANMLGLDPTFGGLATLPSDAPASAAAAADDDDDDDDDDDALAATTAFIQGIGHGATDKLSSQASLKVINAVSVLVKEMSLYKATPPKPQGDSSSPDLNAWHVAKEEAEAAWTDDEADFMFCVEMMDEMAESIDTAAENIRVMGTVTANKKELMDEQGEVVIDKDGATLGFQKPTAMPEKEGEQSGFATASANAAPKAVPMMLVAKKKKKKVEGGAPAEEPNKKQKM